MSSDGVEWLHRIPETGPVHLRLGREGRVLVARWEGIGTLRADVTGAWSEFSAAPGADAAAVEKRMRTHVSALLLQLQGGLALHASCVARGGLALACIGESCAGKSTAAARLCARYSDIEMVADDATLLQLEGDRVDVVPVDDEHWLRADVARALGLAASENEKTALPVTRAARANTPLGALVALKFDDSISSPTFERVRGHRAFACVSLAIFRFAVDEDVVLRRELDNVARILSFVPLYELRRPRDLTNLDASTDALAALLDDVRKERNR